MTSQEFEIFVERSRHRLLAIARHYVGNDDEAEDVVISSMGNATIRTSELNKE